ncbi:MAG: hypothetical protein MHM6MM_002376 [Cercozoa sp. M6MM]
MSEASRLLGDNEREPSLRVLGVTPPRWWSCCLAMGTCFDMTQFVPSMRIQHLLGVDVSILYFPLLYSMLQTMGNLSLQILSLMWLMAITFTKMRVRDEALYLTVTFAAFFSAAANSRWWRPQWVFVAFPLAIVSCVTTTILTLNMMSKKGNFAELEERLPESVMLTVLLVFEFARCGLHAILLYRCVRKLEHYENPYCVERFEQCDFEPEEIDNALKTDDELWERVQRQTPLPSWRLLISLVSASSLVLAVSVFQTATTIKFLLLSDVPKYVLWIGSIAGAVVGLSVCAYGMWHTVRAQKEAMQDRELSPQSERFARTSMTGVWYLLPTMTGNYFFVYQLTFWITSSLLYVLLTPSLIKFILAMIWFFRAALLAAVLPFLFRFALERYAAATPKPNKGQRARLRRFKVLLLGDYILMTLGLSFGFLQAIGRITASVGLAIFSLIRIDRPAVPSSFEEADVLFHSFQSELMTALLRRRFAAALALRERQLSATSAASLLFQRIDLDYPEDAERNIEFAPDLRLRDLASP